jgi:UDP-2,3-diacylglucosamine hydrolase
VPDYFASDIHLRLDRPDRGLRFAGWVTTLGREDTLTIVGDLCDFWLTSRQFPLKPSQCEGLAALVDYRDRGGRLSILPGNHDHWLMGFYEQALGAEHTRDETLDLVSHGLKLHVAHGHRMRAPARWKAVMERDTFLRGFACIPSPLAHALEWTLDTTNELKRKRAEDRQVAQYREFADGLASWADLVVLGHVHRRVDDVSRQPRLIVLGDWLEGESFLRIDERGAKFVVGGKQGPVPAQG